MCSKVFRLSCFFLMALAATTIGCGDHDDHDDHNHSDHSDHEGGAVEEACEHLADGPAESVTAVVDMASTLPSIAADHKRYDIALVDDGNGVKTGLIEFSADEAGDFVVFLNGDVELSVLALADGQEVAAEATGEGVGTCSEIVASSTFEFEVGTYMFSFGPTDAEEVQVVVEHSEHEGHSEE